MPGGAGAPYILSQLTGAYGNIPDFLDSQGNTRVDWLLDLSAPPLGKYPALEQMYGSTDSNGNLVSGAVWAASDINALLAVGGAPQLAQLPQDEVGHGTLVTSCAAGNGEQGRAAYRGVAPNATIIPELIIFVIVLGVMARFVLPPIKKAMDERAEREEIKVGLLRDVQWIGHDWNYQ